MNKQIEALKMAVEAMLKEPQSMEDFEFKEKALNACKEALAEAESESSSQPVAWTDLEGNFTVSPNEKFWYPFPLYTHPATWQSLSDDEIDMLIEKHKLMWMTVDFAHAIEQALKEKNL